MSSDGNTIIYLSNIAVILYKTVGLFTIIVATIGNICNCLFFLRIPALKKHPNALFVVGSSIGSFFFVNIGLIPGVAGVFLGVNLIQRSVVLCKTYTWLYYSAGCFSLMCYSFTAFGQFLITSPKIRWQRLITQFRAQMMILFSSIVWLLIFVPLPIYYKYIRAPSSSSCRITDPNLTIYATYCLVIGYYILPIVSISILFCLTWYNLKQLLRRRRILEGAVTRMMLIQMSVILSSGIPASIFTIYVLATQYTTKSLLRSVYEALINLAFSLFTFLTNGISFWVYLFASKIFRKHVKDYILKWKLFRQRIIPLSTTTTTRANLPH